MSQVPSTELRSNIVSGGSVAAIVPQSMDDAYRLAKAVVLARMAPKGLDTPEACMIAIMHGMEVGLKPLTALQRIAVINGRPTIWGDGAMALVRGSGACEWIEESLAGEGDKMIATCRAKRVGQPTPIVGTFSVADARLAGLWGKNGPWKEFPKRMLQMRARAFCLRDGFADVLGGMYLKEELDSGEVEQPVRRAAPPPPAIEHRPAPSAPALGGPKEPQGEKQRKKAPPPANDEPETDWPAWLESYDSAVCSAESEEELAEHIEGNAAAFADAPADIQADARKLEDAARARIERQAA